MYRITLLPDVSKNMSDGIRCISMRRKSINGLGALWSYVSHILCTVAPLKLRLLALAISSWDNLVNLILD